jgi:hypothetical protein
LSLLFEASPLNFGIKLSNHPIYFLISCYEIVYLFIHPVCLLFFHYHIFQEGTEKDFEILAGTQDGDAFDFSQVLFFLDYNL